MDYTTSTPLLPHSFTSRHLLPLFNRTFTLPTLTPPCIPGEKVPYPDPPPPTITRNISFPFPVETYPEWEVGLKAFGYSVAMAMAVLGNLLVIATVCFSRMLHSWTNFYIVSLAVSDLMVGSLNMWMHLVMSITVEWPFNAAICKAFPFLQILSLTASVLSMTAVAGDRYLAIVHPLKARLSKTYQHAVVMVIVWCIAVAVAVPNLLVREMNALIWADYYQVWCGESWPRYVSDKQGNSTSCAYEYPGRQLYYNLQAVVMYFVPIVAMTCAYGVIIWKMNRRQVPGEQTATVLALQQKVTAKVVTMLVVVLIVFFICWTPQQVVVIMDANWPEYSSSHITEDMRFVFIFVAYFNSSLNPILYAVLNARFRQGFKELWRNIITTPVCNYLRNNKIQPENEINSTEVKTAQSEPGNDRANDVTVVPEVNSSDAEREQDGRRNDVTALQKP